MAKVLVVEDDPLISRLYEEMFTSQNYEVQVAHDGEEGFEKAKSFLPTIILLDVMMPKMNGVQTLEKLKAEATTQKIPVIMLTNLSGDQDSQTALKLGAVKYIVKSNYNPKQIIDMVKEIITGYTRNEVPGTSTPKSVSDLMK